MGVGRVEEGTERGGAGGVGLACPQRTPENNAAEKKYLTTGLLRFVESDGCREKIGEAGTVVADQLQQQQIPR